YTRALLDSIPDLVSETDRLIPIPGNPPSLLNPPSGCPFRPRCSMASEVCADSVPLLETVGDGHSSRCHHADLLAVEATS
ncbi:MAG: oligopeptide/dipeptide ABC transporter ATP-binding protein, partial [Ilumatobacteraceae bacterium]